MLPLSHVMTSFVRDCKKIHFSLIHNNVKLREAPLNFMRCLFGHCADRPRVKFNGASLTYPHVPVSTFRSLFSAAASPLAHHGAGHGAHHHRHDGAHLRLLLRAPNHSILPPPHPHGTARFLFRLIDIISRCARSNLLRRLRPFSALSLFSRANLCS